MRRLITTCFVCLLFCSALAQQDSSSDRLDQVIEDNIEVIASETDRELDYNTLLDQLNYFREKPLNLNAAGKEDLEALTLLNSLQIAALLKHIEENGKLIALEELQTIDGFDAETIYRLLPYVKIGSTDGESKITLRRLAEEGRSSLFLRWQQVLEEPKGYSPKNYETGDTSRYLGSRANIYTRYRYKLGNQISMGFTGQKDAGEDFFHGSQSSGFDFYSAHLFYRGAGWLKSFAVGDYQIQYGQGLTLGTGLTFGKSYDVMNIKKNARGFFPFTSVNENYFMRGAAVSIGGKRVLLDLFYSNHAIDANISSKDTLTQEEIISSVQQSGYHRTNAELQDKHSVGQSLYGGHLQLKQRNLNIGFTAYSMIFDKDLVRTFHLYNQFEFKGNHNAAFGMDYNYAFKNVNFFGEIARSENGGVAYLNGVLASLDPRVGISLLHRHYDKDYHNLFSNGFAESSGNSNEDGLMMGIVTKPAQAFTLSAYYDLYKFPWLRYLVNAPSYGNEYMVQLSYRPTKTFEAYFRMRETNKSSGITGDIHPVNNIADASRTNYRFHVRYKVSDAFTLTNRVELVTYHEGNSNTEEGIMIYQDVNYKPKGGRFSYSVRYVIFDADSYDTRIYAYENDVLYAYSIPFLYNRGNRFYLVLHYRLFRNVDCWLRYGTTVYDNQKSVGSGLDRIVGNQKSDVGAQVRFQF